MTHGSLTERITRSLAYMLRHQPEEFDLELNEHGYGEIGEVVCALNERLGEPIDEDDVHTAIQSGDRPRYEIVDGSIRALYGHSIEIEPGEPSQPPAMLYVGVGSRDAGRADDYGLKGGRRTFLHLALTYEDAQEAGRRIAPNYAVITVHAKDAFESGVRFFDRKALFLSEAIPTEFIEVGETHTDGVLRDTRGRGGRPERGGRERGGRSRDDRPRGRGGRSSERDRDDRHEPREQREPREPREQRRDEHRDAQPPRSEPRKAPANREQDDSGGFGLGIYEKPKPEQSRELKPHRPERAPEPKPEPRVEEPAREEGGDAFGSGIF